MEKKENVSGRIRAKAGVQNGIVSEDEFQRVANKVSFVTIIEYTAVSYETYSRFYSTFKCDDK